MLGDVHVIMLLILFLGWFGKKRRSHDALPFMIPSIW